MITFRRFVITTMLAKNS